MQTSIQYQTAERPSPPEPAATSRLRTVTEDRFSCKCACGCGFQIPPPAGRSPSCSRSFPSFDPADLGQGLEYIAIGGVLLLVGLGPLPFRYIPADEALAELRPCGPEAPIPFA
jgi:hypothetical protein